MDELWLRRREFNTKTLGMMWDAKFGEDFVTLAREDAINGHMTDPVTATGGLLQDKRLSRRTAIRE